MLTKAMNTNGNVIVRRSPMTIINQGIVLKNRVSRSSGTLI
uniref:Uncharacterized protein n=1 Tax=Siphoviridae sp. ctxMM9 TaxID=2827973 RepID=A0A8S5T675_9CAUD|nr:MAG TPA: hypothetical protein [Siphoviridae sp. ctxMM9]